MVRACLWEHLKTFILASLPPSLVGRSRIRADILQNSAMEGSGSHAWLFRASAV